MKLTLTILLSLLTLFVSAQAPTERYFSITGTAGFDGNVLAYIPSDSAANQTKRESIWFFPGSGEQGTGNMDAANAKQNGPGWAIANGWDGTVVVNGVTKRPYIFTIQLASPSTGSDRTDDLVEAVLNKYGSLLDTMKMHYTGLSLGGSQSIVVAAGFNTMRKKPASIVAFSVGTGIGSADVANLGTNYAEMGGKILYLVGDSDPEAVFTVSQILTPMNNAVTGSAIGRTYSGGHSGWNTFYNNSYDIDIAGSINMYEWMMQYDKYPHASAQTSINITAPTSSVTLNGVSSGWYKSQVWTKISGTGTITSSSSDTTTVTGISSTSVFRLTVTNTASGDVDTHDVTVNYTGSTSEYFEIRRKKLNRLKILEN